MSEILKFIKCSMLIVTIFCCINNNCTTSEQLCNSIFEGYVEPFEEMISEYKDDINEKIYCRQIGKSLTPILWAIKCLKKVKRDDEQELKNRLKIIKLLIKKKAEINKKAYILIDELEDHLTRFKIRKILSTKMNKGVLPSQKDQEVLPAQKKLDADCDDFDFINLMRTIELGRTEYLVEISSEKGEELGILDNSNEIEDGFYFL